MELVVVVAIISIMTAVTIVSLQGSKTEKEVETAAREVSAAIREAQNNALTGKNDGSSPCRMAYFLHSGSVNGYSVKGTGGCPVSNRTLGNGVTFKSAPLRVNFLVPFGATSFTPATAGVFAIELIKSSSSYFVCVTQVGSVYEKKDGCP